MEESEVRTPDEFGIRARLQCWWWCGTEGHSRFSSPPYEFDIGFRCPHCHQEAVAEQNRVMGLPVSQVPKLIEAWRDPRSYEGLTVNDIAGGVAAKQAGMAYRLRCPNNHKIDTVVRRFLFDGCPWCRGMRTRESAPSIAEADPEIAATWHPDRNGKLTPESTPSNYSKPLWWQSVQCCGYEWQATITERTLGRRPQRGRGHYYCPNCESVFGSLAWVDPELAAEWHEDNDGTPWHLTPTSGRASSTVLWRCAQDSDHVWEASTMARWNGSQCPQCATSGTSNIEKRFLQAAQVFDPAARPASFGRWRVDVLVPSVELVIEYDGAYWHRDKQRVDARKTGDLTEAGFMVGRVRENDLPHLDDFGDNPTVRQVTFRLDFGSVDDTVADLVHWAAERRGVTIQRHGPSTSPEVAALPAPPSGALPGDPSGLRYPPQQASGVDTARGRSRTGKGPAGAEDRPVGARLKAADLWRPAVPTSQTCSDPGCERAAVFKTRTKPTWCLEHVDAIYRVGGLERLEAFGHPKHYVLTRCITCGCVAHYRFEYVLNQNNRGWPTCRACFGLAMSDGSELLTTDEETVEAAREHAEANGFDYLGPGVGLATHRTRCRRCGKIEADRVCDMGWGCSSCR